MKNDDATLGKISRMLQEHGIRALTMEQIAENLGVTKRTLYNRFADKEDMVRSVVEQHVSEGFLIFEKIVAMDNLNAVTMQTSMFELTMTKHTHLSTLLIKEIYETYPQIFNQYDYVRRNQILNYIIQNVNQGRQEGLYHDDFDPEIISNYMFNSVDNFWIDVLHNRDGSDYGEIFRQVVCCITRGMVTPKGSEILEKEIKRIFKK